MVHLEPESGWSRKGASDLEQMVLEVLQVHLELGIDALNRLPTDSEIVKLDNFDPGPNEHNSW